MNQQNEIEELFYIKKNYSQIKEKLKNNSDLQNLNLLGKIYLNELNLNKAIDCFFKSKSSYEFGYCLFLKGEYDKALKVFNYINNQSSAVKWNIFLIKLIRNEVKDYPTFFQIRNYYERDLDILIQLKQKEAVKTILENIKYLEQFNSEIYKYTARVLLNNGITETAKNYIKKSIDICYKDPENHFIMGEIYEKTGEKEEAKKSYLKVLEVNKDYMPAKEKIKFL